MAIPISTNTTPPNFGRVKLDLNSSGAISVIRTICVAFNVVAYPGLGAFLTACTSKKLPNNAKIDANINRNIMSELTLILVFVDVLQIINPKKVNPNTNRFRIKGFIFKRSNFL